MKKSQLKNIIKEEIQRLQEQSPATNPFNDFLIFTNSTPGLAFDWRCYGGIRGYVHGILQLSNFQSSNPNQPCNFIQGRIDHFTNLLAQAGPNSQSAPIWQCKLNFFNALTQQYNC